MESIVQYIDKEKRQQLSGRNKVIRKIDERLPYYVRNAFILETSKNALTRSSASLENFRQIIFIFDSFYWIHMTLPRFLQPFDPKLYSYLNKSAGKEVYNNTRFLFDRCGTIIENLSILNYTGYSLFHNHIPAKILNLKMNFDAFAPLYQTGFLKNFDKIEIINVEVNANRNQKQLFADISELKVRKLKVETDFLTKVSLKSLLKMETSTLEIYENTVDLHQFIELCRMLTCGEIRCQEINYTGRALFTPSFLERIWPLLISVIKDTTEKCTFVGPYIFAKMKNLTGAHLQVYHSKVFFTMQNHLYELKAIVNKD